MSLSEFHFTEEPQLICGQLVPSICNEITDVDACPGVVDRFFQRYYYRKPGTSDEDHLVLFHSNRICLIGLAPGHVALRKGVQRVNFNIGNADRSRNQCSGKGKKGAMNLQEHSALALLTCSDGSEYKVYGCFNAKLMEVNQRLVDEPALLAEEGDGFVAVALPKMENIDAIKAALLTPAQYAELQKVTGEKLATEETADLESVAAAEVQV